jgi:hypothetical protein
MGKPNNVIARADLTQYAAGLMQDLAAVLRIANLISPVVPTGGTSGLFNKFDETQAFKAYAALVAARAIGGHANAITLLSTTANYNAKPYGLRISVDGTERTNAGEATALLEQAKVRTLQINCAVAYLNAVVTAAKAAVSATAGAGAWGNPNVDPIVELNNAIKAVWKATGMVPNTVMFDFGAWAVFSGHPKIAGRMPGADVAQVSPDRIQRMLVNPSMKVEIVDTSVLTGGGLGNTGATKVGILGGSVLVFNSSPLADAYNPSFMKSFAPNANLFTDVYQYREEPHLDWFENDWTVDPQVVSSGLAKRIDVAGAND